MYCLLLVVNFLVLTVDSKCSRCKYSANRNNLNTQKDNYPTVLLSVFVNKPTPFFQEFLDKIENIDYPKKRLFLSITSFTDYHKGHVNDFIGRVGDQYNSSSFAFHKILNENIYARLVPFSLCAIKGCDYLFYVENEVHLDNPQTLKILIEQNKKIIAPMLTGPLKKWSNFWGASPKELFYAQSFDYMDLVNYEKKGIWRVHYISNCYLMKSEVVGYINTRPSWKEANLVYDMEFCKFLRDEGVPMYVDNQFDFGHLINSRTFNTALKNPEMYQYFANRRDWEKRYVHPDYAANFDPDKTPEQPCPDVFWFPLVSARFCREMIEIMENFGQWHDGSNIDSRTAGGYEEVPTVDIHMKQVGLEQHWVEFIYSHVRPLQQIAFKGYIRQIVLSGLSIVVKYTTHGMKSLPPHHDWSTYTLNIALSSPGIDYEGGGCQFIRYKCKVTDMKLGWLLMHPGQLTHKHEGLEITNGTRYILISFVDPPNAVQGPDTL